MTCKCGVTHTPQAPEKDCPAVLFGEIIEEIEQSIVNQPRSLQRRIGPSELGEPCTRALIRKLGGVDEPVRHAGPDGYRAWVGTQMHAGFERIFTHADWSAVKGINDDKPTQVPRYLVEQRVSVGHINGVEITGSNDLFDILSGTVWDWKTKGKSRLEQAARDIRMGRGPGERYRVQQHLYGRGQQRAGYQVNRVGIIYTPRDGNLRDSFYWSEPYDEQVAVDALNRATGLAQLIAALGVDATLDMYPALCAEEFCDWCKKDRPPPQPFEPGETPSAGDLLAAAAEYLYRRPTNPLQPGGNRVHQ